MPNRKPYIQFTEEEVPRSFYDEVRLKGNKFYETRSHKNYVDFPTYKQLVAQLKKTASITADEKDWYVYVFRSRRGEWGEWFERWNASNGKIIKIKEGWM